MLARLEKGLASLHPLCVAVLKRVLAVLAAMLLSYTALRAAIAEYGARLKWLRCVEAYPLLIFMTAALSLVAVLLMDVYAKTEGE